MPWSRTDLQGGTLPNMHIFRDQGLDFPGCLMHSQRRSTRSLISTAGICTVGFAQYQCDHEQMKASRPQLTI
jgi:hypothetical protein